MQLHRKPRNRKNRHVAQYVNVCASEFADQCSVLALCSRDNVLSEGSSNFGLRLSARHIRVLVVILRCHATKPVRMRNCWRSVELLCITASPTFALIFCVQRLRFISGGRVGNSGFQTESGVAGTGAIFRGDNVQLPRLEMSCSFCAAEDNTSQLSDLSGQKRILLKTTAAATQATNLSFRHEKDEEDEEGLLLLWPFCQIQIRRTNERSSW